MIPTIAILSQ